MDAIIDSLLEVCRKVEAKSFVAATDGNLSVRLPSGNILSTPRQMNKGRVTAADLVEVTMEGSAVHGDRRQSTEIGMHLAIYRQRPDVGAVVHCHPPFATGFAVAGVPLTARVLPEVIVGLGGIPLVPYATPSTTEMGDSLKEYIDRYDAVLLQNHGVVTCGLDVWDAYYKMEKVEQTAHVIFVSTMLGGARQLTPDQLKKLKAVSLKSYGKEIRDIA